MTAINLVNVGLTSPTYACSTKLLMEINVKLLIIIFSGLLAGCSTSFGKNLYLGNVSNTNKISTHEPSGKIEQPSAYFSTPTILAGLGLSFEMTIKDIQKLGFLDMTDSSISQSIGAWSISLNQEKDYWLFKHVYFTPVTQKIFKFTAMRNYSNSLNTASDNCEKDLLLIFDKLRTQYPSLPNEKFSISNTYKSKRIYEDNGGSRSIGIGCSHNDRVSILEVRYTDKTIESSYGSELNKFKNEKINDLLKGRGIPANEF